MATAVFGVAASIGVSKIGLGVGAGLGYALIGAAVVTGAGALGSYIDNKYLFPPDVPNGPRIGECEQQHADEGAPIHFCLGPTNRMAGTIIWMTDIEETTHKHKKNKGCHPNKVMNKTYTYSSSIAIAVCEGVISNIKKIWADRKLIYDADKGNSHTSSELSVVKAELYYYKAQDKDNDPIVHRTYMTIASPDGGPDLSIFNSSEDIVITGFANGGNNGTFRCIRSRIDTGTGESEVVLLNENVVNEAAGSEATLTQTGEKYDPSLMDDITFHTGMAGQNPDSLIEAEEGVGDVPGFRGIAYVVMENFQLADYGNRIPQFQFLVEQTSSKTISSSIGDLLERAGLGSGQYDVTGVSGDLRGYILSGPQSIQGALQPLMVAFDLVMQEDNEILTFIHRTNTSLETLTPEDLAAHDSGTDLRRALTVVDSMGYDLPSEVDVKFVEPASCFLQSSQRERRLNAPADTVLQLQLPIVLTATEAKTIAKRQLWTPWANRQSIQLSLPPSYLDIQENDRISVDIHDVSYTALVSKVEKGNNQLIRIEARIEELHVLSQSATADPPQASCPDIFVPPSLFMTLIDIAPLNNQQNQQAGFYFALSLDQPGLNWPGAVLFRSTGEYYYPNPGYPDPPNTPYWKSGSFDEFYTVGEGATIGEVITAKLGEVESCESWDEINTVTVRMKQGTLSSSTKDDVLNGTNWAVIGGEVIAFVNATLTDTNTYELDTLLRGRRNTEAFNSIHEVNERFILLDDADPINFHAMDLGSINQSWFFKPVPVGGEAGDIDEKEFNLQGNTIRCFAPCHGSGIRQNRGDAGGESEDIWVSWERRTRAIFRHYSGNPCPLLEPEEKYEIEVMDGATVKRIFHITVNPGSGSSDQSQKNIDGVRHITQTVTEREFKYSKANQITDGFTPGDPVTMRFYQISCSIGRGYVYEKEV